MNNRTRNRESAASPSTSTADATVARSPAIITPRRSDFDGTCAAFATASMSTPSCAPCRSSPNSSRVRKSCSASVADWNSAPRASFLARADPWPASAAIRSNVLSTSRSVNVELAAGGASRASRIAAPPTPSRPCRVEPVRKATETATSSGDKRPSSVARRSIFSSRPPTAATAAEVATSSASDRATAQFCTHLHDVLAHDCLLSNVLALAAR